MASLAALLLCCIAATGWAIPTQYTSSATPQVRAYAIPASLAGVKHLTKASDLTVDRREMLARNGFVVVSDRVEQMFFLYEDYGDDYEAGPIPNFITVDSVLQAYHILFDYALRSVEQEHLIGLCTELTHLCAGQTAKQLSQAPSQALREAAGRNLAYFLVARSLLTGGAPSIGANLPGKGDIIAMARDELAKIEAHAGRSRSALTGRTIHYDQFVPRGHYTRTEALGKYFQAMMWYGTVAFELDQTVGEPETVRRHVLQALLITRILEGNSWGQSLWQRIYEPTAFLVGAADDLTWIDYAPVAKGVFGQKLPLSALADGGLVERFMRQARAQLPVPRIAPAFLQADEAGRLEDRLHPSPQGRQLRFMGQRFIPDSYALQQLVYPKVGPRPGSKEPRYWPMGLDVMAILGSRRAESILTSQLRQDEYENYSTQLAEVTAQFAATQPDEWWQNVYWGWLRSLQPLFEEKRAGYPTFMRNPAWMDKELVTSLGSWAQLRHDTILYGKPSGAEMGGAEPTLVQGYVEPYPEVFGRLAYLARLLRDGLTGHRMMPHRLAQAGDRFTDMLLFLKGCAEKQLQNRPLSREEYESIQWFGGRLERLTLDVASDDQWIRWNEITNEADRHIATIADIHTSYRECLEVGVGWANKIYVIVPHPAGGLQLAKGGVLTYHEFRWPVSDRLTDEKWLMMLKNGTAPGMPEWTRSHIAR